MATKRERKKVITEDKRLADYELIFILNPEAEEEKIGTTIDSVTQFISNKGGVVAEVDKWGRRKLAYPIKQFMEGNYVLARFKLKPEVTKELEANLRISEEVLRHLLVKLEG